MRLSKSFAKARGLTGISLFALGNNYQDIRHYIDVLHDISLSNGTINAVTDKLLLELQAWRERELDAGILKASERWTHLIQNWNLTLSQLMIHFPERLDNCVSL